jgi:hypothetical protein
MGLAVFEIFLTLHPFYKGTLSGTGHVKPASDPGKKLNTKALTHGK